MKGLPEYAWFSENTVLNNNERYPHQAANKNANPFGLFDMHGNVWELCSDSYDDHWYSDSPIANPVNGEGKNVVLYQVLRGGGWTSAAASCRSSQRKRGNAEMPVLDQGFRVCFTVDDDFDLLKRLQIEVVTPESKDDSSIHQKSNNSHPAEE